MKFDRDEHAFMEFLAYDKITLLNHIQLKSLETDSVLMHIVVCLECGKHRNQLTSLHAKAPLKSWWLKITVVAQKEADRQQAAQIIKVKINDLAEEKKHEL